MRARNLIVLATAFVLATVLVQGSGEAAGSSQSVFMPSGDLKWTDLDPKTAPGVKIADVWGNHTKGAYGAFIKFPAGFAAPLHTHTNAMKLVIVSGTFIQGPEGKPEVRLGSGSYLYQPGGNYRHTTSCDSASECLFFAQSNGKFDIKVVGAGKAPAKK